MKNLIEISRIVTKKKVKKIEIFDEHSLKNKSSKFNEFYEALLAGKFRNDRDAAAYLYGSTPSDDKYRQIKSRFRKRLLNTLFFLDVNLPSTSTYNRAYFSCNKDWTLVRILNSNEAKHTAAALASQIRTTAHKYKFADVIVNTSRILRKYAAETGDEKNYEIYDADSKQYQNVLDAEIRSEEFYQRVIMNYHKPPSKNADLEEKINIYCDALVSLSEMYDSPVILYNMYLVWAYRYEMLNDFKNVIVICDQAQEYINENPHFYRDDMVSTFLIKRMTAYLHLKDFRSAQACVDQNLKSFPIGTESWATFMEYYFLIAMHTENYIPAVAIFNQIVSNTKFAKLPNATKERWKVLEVYLNYIIDYYQVSNKALAAQPRRSFKLNRFLNDPILFPKHQRILSILYVIGQALFFIQTRKFDEAADRIDRLKGYANRLSKKEEFARINNFIRMLQQLPKHNWNASSLSSHEKYYLRLREQPFKFRGTLIELEVLPFEQIWEMIIADLRKRN